VLYADLRPGRSTGGLDSYRGKLLPVDRKDPSPRHEILELLLHV